MSHRITEGRYYYLNNALSEDELYPETCQPLMVITSDLVIYRVGFMLPLGCKLLVRSDGTLVN